MNGIGFLKTTLYFTVKKNVPLFLLSYQYEMRSFLLQRNGKATAEHIQSLYRNEHKERSF